MRTFTILKTILMSALMLFLFNNVSFAQGCTLFEDFEDMSQNSAYAGRMVTTPSGEWMILGHSQMDTNDRYFGTRSIRLRANNSDPATGAMTIPGEGTEGANVIQMQFDKPNGIGAVSFYYGSYSGHSGGIVSVEYSTDGGTTWIKPVNNSVTAPTWVNAGREMQEFSVPINVQGNARIRIIKYKQSGTQNTLNVDNICVTDFNPEGYVAAPTFNPPSGSYTSAINVIITSATENAIIRYTLDGSDPNEESEEYSTPIAISTQTILKAKAWKEDMEPSVVSTATYIFPQSVNTLSALRALAPEFTGGNNSGSIVYKYTGQAVVTHVQNFNNVKYIQDGSAAIMIFDPTGKITNVEVGDRITSITGTLSNYFGMLQIAPIEDCENAGYFYTVPATYITLNQLDNDPNNPIQAKIIRVEDVLYMQTGNFERGKYYDLKQNDIVYDSVVYTDKFEAEYIGQQIPTYITNITGVCNFKGGSGIPTRNRIVPLDDEGAVKITNINKSAIKLAPNPASSFVNIVTGAPMKLEVYSLLGNLIHVESLSEGSNTISVSNYPAGVYMMKLTNSNTGQSFIQKLVVK